MKASTPDDLEAQLNAVLGFVLWLKFSPSEQTVESGEFREQLIHTLRMYGWELNRRIDGEAATEEWINIVAVTSMLAEMLLDEFVETHPELAGYRSTDEPTTLDEMTVHLLSAAVDHFETYSLPEALAPISDLVQRIGNAPAA